MTLKEPSGKVLNGLSDCGAVKEFLSPLYLDMITLFLSKSVMYTTCVYAKIRTIKVQRRGIWPFTQTRNDASVSVPLEDSIGTSENGRRLCLHTVDRCQWVVEDAVD